MRLKISTKALDDHESRLYGHDDSTDTVLVHQDKVGATYTIIKRTKTVTTVEMSAEAIADLLDDGDYQAEFNSEDNDPYGLMWARAIKSVRKQINQ